MVLASRAPSSTEKIRDMELPIINFLDKRSDVSKLIVKASEDFGFFKVINHGVSEDIIRNMEVECFEFFGKTVPEKQRAGLANPYGYGSKNIGFNGDSGEVEYLIMDTNNPLSIFQRSQTIASADPTRFSCAVNVYMEAIRKVACEVLEMMAEGLGVPDTSVFSSLITDLDNDSLLRLNHYPPLLPNHDTSSAPSFPLQINATNSKRIGFGEHTDPQILTVLRSNGVAGLQISLGDGVWVPISPDPTALCVNVGDVLQAMTNGRFVSVIHRAMANSKQARMSMAYFCAPPFHANITCPKELVTLERPNIYRAFTWAEYKKVVYSLRLGDSRLELFKLQSDDETRD
ncbi:Gibberellin 2-beta-dioxygenase 2 [Heracleum sosnowskyi]|uniref:gibberellin 2beta-dioxygenase n=1 Tax=Heracleum sosnowskyi TaxID=360622 RepID=A0AAD8IJ70_9APIA|nr:Gibberellin 2-beta-dioxygenase 2 [Heracleum sosnowskyi]